MCVTSLNLVTLTVLKKRATKIYLITGQKEGMMDGRNDRRTRSIQCNSTFSKRGYNELVYFVTFVRVGVLWSSQHYQGHAEPVS